MPKAKKLKDIKVTFISLVQEGANQKEIIYKSKETPSWQKDIPITKATEEGIVYGIVYSPNEKDTQGDMATAEEIKKAAYNFLKEKRVDAVDVQHSYEKAKAFVCESWILKKDDPLFPNEKEGSWAVGIKLEDETLKKAVKEGKIKALSMAGVAQKEDIKKNDLISFETVIEAFKSLFQNTSIELRGSYYQKDKGDSVPDNKLQKEDLTEIFKTALKEGLNESIKPLQEEIKDLKTSLQKQEEQLQKQEEVLNKSSQQINLHKQKNPKNVDDSILA